MNIIFDLAGAIFAWQPNDIIARVFPDPIRQSTVRPDIVGHPDWLALDRGILHGQDVIARAAKRMGLHEPDVAYFLSQVPPGLVTLPGSVDLLYRLKDRGRTLYCLSNMHRSFIKYLEAKYSFWRSFSRRVILSCVQLLKPEPDIYAYLVNTHGLNVNETISLTI